MILKFQLFLESMIEKMKEKLEPEDFLTEFKKTVQSFSEDEFNFCFYMINTMMQNDTGWDIRLLNGILILEWLKKHNVIVDYKIDIKQDKGKPIIINLIPIFAQEEIVDEFRTIH